MGKNESVFAPSLPLGNNGRFAEGGNAVCQRRMGAKKRPERAAPKKGLYDAQGRSRRRYSRRRTARSADDDSGPSCRHAPAARTLPPAGVFRRPDRRTDGGKPLRIDQRPSEAGWVQQSHSDDGYIAFDFFLVHRKAPFSG